MFYSGKCTIAQNRFERNVKQKTKPVFSNKKEFVELRTFMDYHATTLIFVCVMNVQGIILYSPELHCFCAYTNDFYWIAFIDLISQMKECLRKFYRSFISQISNQSEWIIFNRMSSTCIEKWDNLKHCLSNITGKKSFDRDNFD